MNGNEIIELGFKEGSVIGLAKFSATSAENAGLSKDAIRQLLSGLLNDPEKFKADIYFSDLANSIIEINKIKNYKPVEKPWAVWGDSGIEESAKKQMTEAMSAESVVVGALMADSHLGYGLPIGGVVATRNTVFPYFVGVDIACRMKMSIFEIDPKDLGSNYIYKNALESCTRFGLGCHFEKNERHEHSVMDDFRWNELDILKRDKDKSWSQLGTSGGGNHFVEFGSLEIKEEDEVNFPGMKAGTYVALMSHSGSRAAGSAICQMYHAVAQGRLPDRHKAHNKLAWLDLDSDAGEEYWMAMNLMGDYASANHDCIHKSIAKEISKDVVFSIENHHNFAWIESHMVDGKLENLIVHRKGATPAGLGVLGVIPGSMGTSAYVVKGKGNAVSLNSASHGAGRRMSRTVANATYDFKTIKEELAKQGIQVLSSGSDEVPGAYKDIETVMIQQSDLVVPIAKFSPKIVKMSDDGKAED